MTETARKFKVGDWVEDNEGDTGTVIGYTERNRVMVDGDSGTSPWTYREDELDLLGTQRKDSQ